MGREVKGTIINVNLSLHTISIAIAGHNSAPDTGPEVPSSIVG